MNTTSLFNDQSYYLINKIYIISGIHILPFILVALLWGSTDVLIAKASVQSINQFKPNDFSPIHLIKFIWNKKIWIWMAINQIGSVLYAYLLGIYPEQYSLIWANSLTVLVAFALQKISNYFQLGLPKTSSNNDSTNKQKFGRKDIQNIFGIGFILGGIYLMLI